MHVPQLDVVPPSDGAETQSALWHCDALVHAAPVGSVPAIRVHADNASP
jgi:hypothetical protein